jgi:SAM-dependent methyltransferase
MRAMSPDEEDLRAYYDTGAEYERLNSPLGVVEFERTKEILQGHLPAPPATIADIGGGPGRYATWLASLGYRVIHRDIVPLHVEQLRRDAEAVGVAIDANVGDARALDLADETADAVLLLGPLYHLTDRSDRVAALKEAGRITRDGAVLFVAAISRWAPRLHAVLVERLHQRFPSVLDVIGDVEATGVMPPLYEGSFSGYTHRPDELIREIRDAGLEPVEILNVEGLAFALPDLEERVADPSEREVVLQAARVLERIPELMGCAPHFMVVARTGSRPA